MKLFTTLTIAAEQWLSDLNPQEVANTAWVFATVGALNDASCGPKELGAEEARLFTALASAAEWRAQEFNPSTLTSTLWVFATVGWPDILLFAVLAKVLA